MRPPPKGPIVGLDRHLLTHGLQSQKRGDGQDATNRHRRDLSACGDRGGLWSVRGLLLGNSILSDEETTVKDVERRTRVRHGRFLGGTGFLATVASDMLQRAPVDRNRAGNGAAMKMFSAGKWVETAEKLDVNNPYDGSLVDTVPRATAADVDAALATLVRGAEKMRTMSAYDRSHLLRRAAESMKRREEELAKTICAEEGKILAEARLEASRARETIEVSAEEARRVVGEMVPVDAAPGAAGRVGFTLRVPCGIVAAITPFNFPLNLVCHKVGPALAAGNAVIIKPASDTPLSALKLVEILLEAGTPAEAIACLTGSGSTLGTAICGDRRVRKISFTGSYEVGERICKAAGMKKVTMELGSNSPVIIMDDADIDKAAEAVTSAGFANAGQVCISAQRILTSQRVSGAFLDALKPRVEALTVGNPVAEGTKIGPLVREAEAMRVAARSEEHTSELQSHACISYAVFCLKKKK
jgi:glyceraldehyde-3-phosphate dehydrogenase (NADP+)